MSETYGISMNSIILSVCELAVVGKCAGNMLTSANSFMAKSK